jgi:hypothetical protein
MKKTLIAALAACAMLPALAQSLDHRPSESDARQARENAKRDAKMADAMEKARLQEDARPVSAYIPKEQAQPVIKEHRPELFTAAVPGEKKKKKSGKKKTAKND